MPFIHFVTGDYYFCEVFAVLLSSYFPTSKRFFFLHLITIKLVLNWLVIWTIPLLLFSVFFSLLFTRVYVFFLCRHTVEYSVMCG